MVSRQPAVGNDPRAGGFSQRESAPARTSDFGNTLSCLAVCFATPMGPEVTSSIPSSVKPAFSSLTYFSHSAVLEQCPTLFPV